MARDIDPTTVLGSVLPGRVDALDAAGAAHTLCVIRHLRSHLDAYEARVTTHVRGLHADGESAPAADLHTRCGGVSSKEAATKERRAEILDDAPSLAERLAAGAATAAHADVLANAASKLDDTTRRALLDHQADLADDAARTSPEEFRRNCRDLIRMLERDQGVTRDRQQRHATRVTMTVDRDGMFVLHARLHPELGTAVFNAVDAETAALIKQGGDRGVDRSAVAADALGNLVVGGHQARRPTEAEIRIHVDARTLIDGPHPDGVCEYDNGEPIPPSSVRRMRCNGRIIPIVIDTSGVVLDAGREQRLANRHQRRALRAMYPTCAMPGCDVTFERCEVHHIVPFELGGHTDLAELLPLCSRHHHVIHEPGWHLRLTGDRTLVITQPGGAEIRAPLPSSPKPDARSHGTEPPAERPPTDDPTAAAVEPSPGDQLDLIA